MHPFSNCFNLILFSVDCWDGDDGEPIITHGLTLTSEIHFEDVVKVVKDYGFKVSQ